MINFCTLFDSNYLTRGIALYESLKATCSEFHLYVVAFNDSCYQYLHKAPLEGLTPIMLKEFEDAELLRIKPTRSSAEYCWTCTPSIILYCLKNFDLPSCTYIDADMIFYHDPHLLFDEMGEKSIFITEHNYTREYDQSEQSGKYCVQFMIFKNNQDGLAALTWWRDRCIEWCYARVEDGKFGDQKYLDEWHTRFAGVQVSENPGAGVAPWNVQHFRVSEMGGKKMITHHSEQKSHPLIFYHFHGVKFYTDDKVSCCGPIYEIRQQVKEQLYFPYFKKLLSIEKQLVGNVEFNVNGAKVPAPGKTRILLDFFKDRLLLLKSGNISIQGLKFKNFKKNHFHFYKLNRKDGTIDRS